jgi:hypothetical protein
MGTVSANIVASDGTVPAKVQQGNMTMQYFTKIGGNVAAAIGALAITMAMLSVYFAPVMASPVPVLLA